MWRPGIVDNRGSVAKKQVYQGSRAALLLWKFEEILSLVYGRGWILQSRRDCKRTDSCRRQASELLSFANGSVLSASRGLNQVASCLTCSQTTSTELYGAFLMAV